jgi:hypothetical protein
MPFLHDVIHFMVKTKKKSVYIRLVCISGFLSLICRILYNMAGKQLN